MTPRLADVFSCVISSAVNFQTVMTSLFSPPPSSTIDLFFSLQVARIQRHLEHSSLVRSSLHSISFIDTVQYNNTAIIKALPFFPSSQTSKIESQDIRMYGIAKTSLVLSALLGAQAFAPSTTFNAVKVQQSIKTCSTTSGTSLYSEAESTESIVSPFDNDGSAPEAGEIFELTWDNVEKVLDGMRPYLIQDGGNVSIAEIDGPIVRLQLEGACGTCPSSTQTMKMGLERGLREKIPEIQEVIQAMPEGPDLDQEQVEVILDGVRPFLKVAGGTIICESITGEGSMQPSVNLKMEGTSASLNSVKLEISQRLQRHFMLAGLQVEFL